jgi:YNFM family putative membrane transporter
VVLSVLALAALYAPQPLLPQWAERYGRPQPQVALVISVALLPLAVSPLAAGALLQQLATVHLMRAASAVLAFAVAATAWAPPFAGLLALRVVQGAAVAAVLTALMTHITQTREGADRQTLMAIYVAATILGGFLGRLGAGLVASVASDEVFFLGLAGMLLATDLGLRRMPTVRPEPSRRHEQTRLADLLRHGPVLRICAFVFGLFFVFSALMNFLPFRLQQLRPTASEGLAGAAYVGYLVGIGASLSAQRIAEALRHPRRAMVLGGCVALGSLLVAAGDSVALLFGSVALLCLGFFLAHAVAASRVSAVAPGNATRGSSVVNGLYVSIYYAGGVLGAYAPGFVYDAYGWAAFLVLLAVMSTGGIAALCWRG